MLGFVHKRGFFGRGGSVLWLSLLAALAVLPAVHAQLILSNKAVDGPAEGAGRNNGDTAAAARRLAQDDVAWIARKTGWRNVSVPRIETKSGRELSIMFFGAAEGIDGLTPLALYGRETHVLFLSDRLVFDNLVDQSILLHELVHHMQVVNTVPSACREAAEGQAYRLQVMWLAEHGVADPYALLGISQYEVESLTCP
jgi:hypothetical protein